MAKQPRKSLNRAHYLFILCLVLGLGFFLASSVGAEESDYIIEEDSALARELNIENNPDFKLIGDFEDEAAIEAFIQKEAPDLYVSPPDAVYDHTQDKAVPLPTPPTANPDSVISYTPPEEFPEIALPQPPLLSKLFSPGAKPTQTTTSVTTPTKKAPSNIFVRFWTGLKKLLRIGPTAAEGSDPCNQVCEQAGKLTASVKEKRSKQKAWMDKIPDLQKSIRDEWANNLKGEYDKLKLPETCRKNNFGKEFCYKMKDKVSRNGPDQTTFYYNNGTMTTVVALPEPTLFYDDNGKPVMGMAKQPPAGERYLGSGSNYMVPYSSTPSLIAAYDQLKKDGATTETSCSQSFSLRGIANNRGLSQNSTAYNVEGLCRLPLEVAAWTLGPTVSEVALALIAQKACDLGVYTNGTFYVQTKENGQKKMYFNKSPLPCAAPLGSEAGQKITRNLPFFNAYANQILKVYHLR